jgi:hypothetical protein
MRQAGQVYHLKTILPNMARAANGRPKQRLCAGKAVLKDALQSYQVTIIWHFAAFNGIIYGYL